MKALASDYDGTLYFGYSGSSGQGFKEEDLKAIRLFQSKGNLFGICTGRPFKGLVFSSKEKLETKELIYDFYIVSTGACILDRDHHILYENRIDKKLAEAIVNEYKDQIQTYAHVGTENVYAFNQKGGFPIPQNVVKDINEIQNESILGVSIEGKTVETATRIYKELQEKYGNQLEIFINHSDIDIVNKGVSKGKACKVLKELLSIDTLCGIGDNYNDIPMLENTDISFTFHSSPDGVKKKANIVVESIQDCIVNHL